MDDFKSVEDVLDYAIAREEEAAAFYTDLAGRVDKAWMKEVFSDFAKEEKGHKAKLEQVKAGSLLLKVKDKIIDLKIGDYLVDVDTEGELDYQAALVVAMKREKAAFRLYTDLADRAGDDGLRETFLALAQEEAKHKLRFEVEYDDLVLTDN